jgi:hypothetical protein
MRVVRQRRFPGHPRELVGIVLGPGRCVKCRATVWYARGLTRVGWNGEVIQGWLAWRDPSGGVHEHNTRRIGPRLPKNMPGAKAA